MESLNQSNNIPYMSLLSNKKIELTKINSNTFKLVSLVENKNIYLEKIITFDLIRLCCKVNMDYFDVVELEILNDNEAILFILMKPLFKELGLQSRYVNLKIIKKNDKSDVYFMCNKSNDFTSKTIQYKNAIQSPISNINIFCKLLNPHLIQFSETLSFDEPYDMNTIMEKIISHILKVIFKKTIKTIEQLNIK